ncbi:phosphatase 2C-like domain-containing protein [Phakopsora pachyrhizi]|uniref:Phosphatase 2C-like domain-containing protein n=1 Tax=Phakopsora pachyrhizi TaxID=170000 RepID=A0AAV0B6Z7_PHAPC|nr:phosphatase 2C-like domain-containing protein [Phakopsora pachyrhizi]
MIFNRSIEILSFPSNLYVRLRKLLPKSNTQSRGKRKLSHDNQIISDQRGSFSCSSTDGVKLIQKFEIPKVGNLRVYLKSDSTIGISQSRGERPYQEDRTTVGSLHLQNSGLIKSISGLPLVDRVDLTSRSKSSCFQALLVGVIDGHGGSEASEFLAENLPRLVEECESSQVPKAIRTYRAIGGYFKRFRGGYLESLGELVYSKRISSPIIMGLAERLYLAFMLADQSLIESHPKSGAVATVALVCPLEEENDQTQYPWFSSKLVSLTIAHVGDTMALLCNSKSGRAIRLTQDHHPDSRIESERLRRIGSGLITDSFGESRWGGTLANTRGLGDSNFKKIGVTGEPDIMKRILRGCEDWAFLALVSDGISGVITDQEIVDLCRGQSNPKTAAERIVKFAEQLGSRDNMTVMILPFMMWGKIGGEDLTFDRREFRLKQISNQNIRQRRM